MQISGLANDFGVEIAFWMPMKDPMPTSGSDETPVAMEIDNEIRYV